MHRWLEIDVVENAKFVGIGYREVGCRAGYFCSSHAETWIQQGQGKASRGARGERMDDRWMERHGVIYVVEDAYLII